MESNFLRDIAAYYCERNGTDLSSLTFVTPNKRSAMFLKKYFRDIIKEYSTPSIFPKFFPLNQWIANISESVEASRNELLFTVYEAYRKTFRDNEKSGMMDFEEFVFWGDILINDFNEIDSSLVDADGLFKNIKRLREIQSDFLDEEQKEVVRRIWGDQDFSESERFWLHLREGENLSDGEKSFKTLWELLGKIYDNFQDILKKSNISSSGSIARKAYTKIHEMGVDEFREMPRHVFVGLDSDISTSQWLILQKLKEAGNADFFWDISPTMCFLGDDGPTSSSLKRLVALSEEFKSPVDFHPGETINQFPKIEVISTPSKIAQAKNVKPILEEWNKEKHINPSDALNTAIIIPDESLLMPVLFSIPEDIQPVNVTMGIPFATTTFAALLNSIISMQIRAHNIRGENSIFFEDVVAILNHPHIRLICGVKVDDILKMMAVDHVYNMTSTQLSAYDNELAENIFRIVKDSETDIVADYFVKLINWLQTGIEKASGKKAEEMLESKFLNYFKTEVLEILKLAQEFKIEVTDKSYFVLIMRILSTSQLSVIGLPLCGLQIMGLLETRALDFDNIIILSMNEGKLPKKNYSKTMIPNSLRYAYGLAPINSREGTYAYCFYRLLSRAKNVKLIYDSRTGNFGAGEESRYISQLKYLIPSADLCFRNIEPQSNFGEIFEIIVHKSPEVLRELESFKHGKGQKYLSASAIKVYKSCPLRFYLQTVKGYRTDEEPTNYMTDAQYGSIFHRSFELLFEPYRTKDITADILESMASNHKHLSELIRQAMFEILHPRLYKERKSAPELNSEEETYANVIAQMMPKLLRQEIKTFTSSGSRKFKYIEGEKEVKGPWHISEDLTINFKMYIDRVDLLEDGSFRFIDYKTGSDEKDDIDIFQIFNPNYSKHSDAVLQLLIYCEAYKDLEGFNGPIQPLVYKIRESFTQKAVSPITYGESRKTKYELTNFQTVSPMFRPQLEDTIKKIFDTDTPFSQCVEGKNSGCTYCPFTSLCGRNQNSLL